MFPCEGVFPKGEFLPEFLPVKRLVMVAEVTCLVVVVVISFFGMSGEVLISSGMVFVRNWVVSSPMGSVFVDGVEGAFGLVGDRGMICWALISP